MESSNNTAGCDMMAKIETKYLILAGIGLLGLVLYKISKTNDKIDKLSLKVQGRKDLDSEEEIKSAKQPNLTNSTASNIANLNSSVDTKVDISKAPHSIYRICLTGGP